MDRFIQSLRGEAEFVIHVHSVEEATSVLKYISTERHFATFDCFKEATVFFHEDSGEGIGIRIEVPRLDFGYSDIKWYERNGYEIHEFSEFNFGYNAEVSYDIDTTEIAHFLDNL